MFDTLSCGRRALADMRRQAGTRSALLKQQQQRAVASILLLVFIVLYACIHARDVSVVASLLAGNTLSRTPSCLIIILGGVRAHQLTWQSFQSHFWDRWDCDLAVCMSTRPNVTHDDPFTLLAKYKWLYPEPADWADAFNFAATTEGRTVDSWRSILRVRGILFGGIQDPALEGTSQSSAGIVMFYRWFLLHCMRRDGVDMLYDRFIITRPDYLYEVPHPPSEVLDPSYIWSPAGEDWGGVTDRHTIVSRADLETVLTPLRTLLVNPEPLYEVLKQDDSWNLEKFLAFHLYNAGVLHRVRRFPSCMYTVRGKDDPAFWPTGHWSEELGLHLKYPDEYASTQRTKAMLGNRTWKDHVKGHGLKASDYAFLPLYNPMSGQNWPYRTDLIAP